MIQKSYRAGPRRALPLYEQFEELPPLLNNHVMAPMDGITCAVNQYPYAEFLEARDAILAAEHERQAAAGTIQKSYRTGRKRQPPPPKLNLAQRDERDRA